MPIFYTVRIITFIFYFADLYTSFSAQKIYIPVNIFREQYWKAESAMPISFKSRKVIGGEWSGLIMGQVWS